MSISFIEDRNRPLLLALIALVVFILFWKLGAWGLSDPTEGRYAEIALEMVRSGDYLHPHYFGIQHYHKPPLTYWITAAAIHVFGATAFAARFFLQVAFILQCVFVFGIASLIYPEKRKRLLTVLIYASFFIVWVSIRSLSTDAFLTTSILGSAWALLAYAKKGNAGYLYLAALIGGLGFLTKITALLVYMGPVAIAIWYANRKTWKWSIHILLASLLFLLVSASWFIMLELEGIPITSYALYYQSFERYVTDEFHRSQPFYFYLVLGPALCLPWSFMAVHGFFKAWRQKALPGLTTAGMFIGGSLLPFLLFQFSGSKLVLYILPAYPFLAILLPDLLKVLSMKEQRVWYGFAVAVYGIAAVGLGITGFNEDIFLDPTVPVIGGVVILLVQGAVLLFGGHDIQFKTATAAFAFILTTALFLPMIMQDLPDAEVTTKQLAVWVKDEGMRDRQVFIYDTYAPSFAYHLNRPIKVIFNGLERETQFESSDGYREYFYDLQQPKELPRLLNALKTPSILLVKSNNVDGVNPAILNTFAHSKSFGDLNLYY